MVNSSLEFSLIPYGFFQAAAGAGNLAGALIKENADLDHLEYRDMEHSGATAIYTVPFPMKQKCDHFFPELQYQPFCYLMVNMGLRNGGAAPQPAVAAHF
jgi:lysozyme family protein